MSLDRQQVIHGNMIAEGIVAPHSTSWPPGAEDGQLFWKLPEQQMYVYDLSLDSWVAVGTKQYHFEPIMQDFVQIRNLPFATVRSGQFFSKMRNNNMVRLIAGGSTFDTLWRFAYWQFSLTTSPNSWSSPTQFATENDFFTFLESFVPSVGGVYSQGVTFRTFEAVDDSDSYPTQVRHRNSLVASMRGWGNWVRGPGSGVSSKFNSPAYYLNFYNEVGQRFAQTTGGAIATNNDGVVWYHRGSRGTLWRWPRVGGTVTVIPGYKGSAWDSLTDTYVSPAPTGDYSILNPFFLCEVNPRILQIISSGLDSEQRSRELFHPMALVFPVVLTGRYYGYVVVPHGSDSFITEYLDLGNYDLVVACKFRHTGRKIYVGGVGVGATDGEHTLFNLRTFPFNLRDNTGVKISLDKDSIPIQIDIARRSRSTGMRSPWFPVYRVNRRIHHAAYRVDPAPWKK